MFKDSLIELKRQIDWLKRVLKLNARNITGNPRDTVSELFANQGEKYAIELSTASQELLRRTNGKASSKAERRGKESGKASKKPSKSRPKTRAGTKAR